MSVGLWYWGRRGGGSRFTRTLAAGLDDLAVPTVVSLSQANEAAAWWRSGERPVGWVQLDRRPGTLRTLNLLGPGRRSLGAWFERHDADVVVFTMLHPLLGPCLSAVRRRGLRTVLVVHDATPHPGDGARWVHAWSRRAARRADVVVALSHHVAAELERSWNLRGPVAVMPHGPLYPGVGEATRRPSSPDGFRFLCFGRLRDYKGLDLLLNAWSQVVAAVPGASLSIVGQGDADSWETRALAFPSVRVDRRWVPDGEVPELLLSHDAVVLAYREASQSGVIPLAHEFGLPVVATRVGGIPEQVGDADVLVDATPEALALGMIEAATRSPVVVEPGPTARDVAQRLVDILTTKRDGLD